MTRPNNRLNNQLRPATITVGAQRSPAGSVIISTGNTRVLCAATVECKVPRWMKEQNKPGGWVTAEYSMLPGSGDTRVRRGTNSRATEIQRLIARALRGAIDLQKLDGVTITVDCDVLDADGGTRTASITGAWVALSLACRKLVKDGVLTSNPITSQIAATSVGIVDGEPRLDLEYVEDAAAETDMNVVGQSTGDFIEVQGTAEGAPFSRAELDSLLDLATKGIQELCAMQTAALQTAE